MKKSVLLGGAAVVTRSNLLHARDEEKQAKISDKQAQPNETIKTIRNLRTIHGNFTDREIPDETIDLILQSSIRTANASNMQSYSIIVVKDQAKMQQVCTYRGSCMLLYCVDFTRLKACAKHLGHPYFPDNITSFITASINTAIAAQTAVIAARSIGIDSLMTNGVHRGDMERVWKLPDLPQSHCFPLIAVVLGYPTKEPDYQMGRLNGPGVIHHETFHQLTQKEIEDITQQYDDKQCHLTLSFDQDWDKQGYKHYLVPQREMGSR